MKRVGALAGALLLAMAPAAEARGGHRRWHSHSTSYRTHREHRHRGPHHRDRDRDRDRGDHRRRRDPAQRRAFQREHPCPSTGRTWGACPGYVVDHVQALKHGGRDHPSNMQWQTVEEAKAKDRWE